MPVYKVYRYKLKSSERSDLGSGETATEQARKEESESAIRRVVGGVSREEGKGGSSSSSDTHYYRGGQAKGRGRSSNHHMRERRNRQKQQREGYRATQKERERETNDMYSAIQQTAVTTHTPPKLLKSESWAPHFYVLGTSSCSSKARQCRQILAIF